MRLVWSATAERELEHIADYIGVHNPHAATKVELRLRTAVEHLQQFPRAGRPTKRTDTREIVIVEFPYVLRYRVKGSEVQILRIFNTAQHIGRE
jgi:toxin ParE1/3/4